MLTSLPENCKHHLKKLQASFEEDAICEQEFNKTGMNLLWILQFSDFIIIFWKSP